MKLRMMTFVAVTLFAVNAYAEPDFRRDVLLPIDTIPTAQWLDATFDDPQGQLIEAAKTSTSYERRRAITLLSLYPNARTRDALQSLVATGDSDTRSFAIYTLGRMYGPVADDALVKLVIEHTAVTDAEVAKWATRALRWLASPDAVKHLEAMSRADGPHAGIARRALRKHVSTTAPLN